MTVSFQSRLESSLRLFFGFLLWVVSATLTVLLLISLGSGSLPEKVLLGVVAVALEGSKILSWRAGGRTRVLAIALICLSGIASLGAALQVVEKSKSSFNVISLEEVRSSPDYLAKVAEIRSLDAEISALIDRMKILPDDFTTATSKIMLSLSSLRDRKTSLLDSMAGIESSVGASPITSSMVGLLGREIGWKPETVLLVLLLFLSGSIEAGALILTSPNLPVERFSKDGVEKLTSSSVEPVLSPSYCPPIDAESFLEAAKAGSKDGFLRGRDRTAEILGISYADGKRLVRQLLESGRVVVEGKRLRLSKWERAPILESARERDAQ